MTDNVDAQAGVVLHRSDGTDDARKAFAEHGVVVMPSPSNAPGALVEAAAILLGTRSRHHFPR